MPSEKGIEMEVKPTTVADPDPDFCAASPFGKMPAISDGDYRLADSSPSSIISKPNTPSPT